MNEFHEANRKGWNEAARAGRGQVDDTRHWKACFRDASQFFHERELPWLANVSGKAVCVLGAGDNLAVFALAGLGAEVTSVDISEEQLKVASGRASEVGAGIAFVRADVTDLSNLESETFDAVYTGGHVAVWVSDLKGYYREAGRILKPGGLFMVSEYHPFRRIWKDEKDALRQAFTYFDRGPQKYDRADEIPGAEAGSLPSYEFHWTVSDYITAVLEAGCTVLAVEEFGTGSMGWEIAP
ncbi:MAG: class I SAM-dependent methyltransferase, partial [Planctomycetota bacterium]